MDSRQRKHTGLPQVVQFAQRRNGLLLLLLSHFSRVQLCATPQTAAPQTPPSLGFSRQEHWSGLPFPSPMRESEVAQLCPTLSNPKDCSPPGSSVHGIFQARVLEWDATAFSGTCVRIRYLYFSLLTSLCIIGSRLIPLIRTDSNVFLFMAE